MPRKTLISFGSVALTGLLQMVSINPDLRHPLCSGGTSVSVEPSAEVQFSGDYRQGKRAG